MAKKVQLSKMGVNNSRKMSPLTKEEKEKIAQRKKDLDKWREFQKSCPQHIWVTANPLYKSVKSKKRDNKN